MSLKPFDYERCGKELNPHIGYSHAIGYAYNNHSLAYCSSECMKHPDSLAKAERMKEMYRASLMAIEAFFDQNKLTLTGSVQSPQR